jgi:hypothetical protein
MLAESASECERRWPQNCRPAESSSAQAGVTKEPAQQTVECDLPKHSLEVEPLLGCHGVEPVIQSRSKRRSGCVSRLHAPYCSSIRSNHSA